MYLLPYVIFLTGISVAASEVFPEEECLITAACYMSIGDIYRSLKLNYTITYDKARTYIKNYDKFKECGAEGINRYCQENSKLCHHQLRTEALSTGISQKILHQCDATVISYNLLLCPGKKAGHWPKDIYDKIIPNYEPCGMSCFNIEDYHKYHIENGKTFPQDFPERWEKDLELAKLEKQFQTSKEKDEISKELVEDAKKLGIIFKESKMQTKANTKDWIVYEYVEHYANLLVTGLLITEEYKCPINTWIGAVQNNIPFSVYSLCFDSSLKAENKPMLFAVQKSKGTSLNKHWMLCNYEGFKRITPDTGSFLVGIRIKKGYIDGINYVDSVKWLCSGDASWSTSVDEPSNEETDKINNNEPYDNELKCPQLTAVCSMQFVKRDIIGQGNIYVMKIRIGCCKIPWNMYYSGTNAVILPTEYDDYTEISVELFTAGKYKYICPPGEFIHKINLVNLLESFEQRCSGSCGIKRTACCYGCSSGDYFCLCKWHQCYYYTPWTRPLPIIRTEFYCRGLTTGSVSKKLTKNLYSHLNLQAIGETADKSVSCQNSFAYQYTRVHRSHSRRYPEWRSFDYILRCNDNHEKKIANIDINKYPDPFNLFPGFPIFKPEPVVDEGVPFHTLLKECPKKHGLCGVIATVPNGVKRHHVVEEYHESDNSFTGYKLPDYDHSFTGTPLTSEGYTFNYVCCPIPTLIIDQECPKGVTYDIEVDKFVNEKNCTPPANGGYTCSISTSSGYTIGKNSFSIGSLPVGTPVWYDRKKDVLNEIIKTKDVRFGPGFYEYTIMNEIDRYIKITKKNNKNTGVAIGAFSENLTPAQQFIKNIFLKAVKSGLSGPVWKSGFDVLVEWLIPFPPYVSDDPSEDLVTNLEDIAHDLYILKHTGAIETEYSNGIGHTVSYHIPEGSMPLFYDMTLSCGGFKLTSEHHIKYITPAICKKPSIKYERLRGYLYEGDSFGDKPFARITDGYGMNIVELIASKSVSSILNWNHLSKGVQGEFMKPTYDPPFNGIKTDKTLYERYTEAIKYEVKFTVKNDENAILYELVAVCNDWEVHTSKIYIRLGTIHDVTEYDTEGDANWKKVRPVELDKTIV